jgi:outer membrane lipoprotein-sorting protein
MDGKESDMRRVLCFLFLITALTLPVSVRAGEDADSVMARMQVKYRHLEAASASYTRDVITRSMSMMGMQTSGDLATGHLFFQFPHFIRMEQEKPTHEILVSDGVSLLWYVPDKKTLYQYPAEKFGRELSVFKDLFRGLDTAEKKFHTALMTPADPKDFLLKLTPDPPWDQIDYLVVALSRTLDIKTLEIHNLLGSVTRFSLTDVKPTDPFQKDFFKLRVPDDTQIIREK